MDPTAALNTPATEAAEAQASIAGYLTEIDQLREQMHRDQAEIDRSQQRTWALLADLKAVLAHTGWRAA